MNTICKDRTNTCSTVTTSSTCPSSCSSTTISTSTSTCSSSCVCSCRTGTITCSCCNNQDCNPCDYSVNASISISISIKTSSSRNSSTSSGSTHKYKYKYKYKCSSTNMTGRTTLLVHVLLLMICFYFCNVSVSNTVVKSESAIFKSSLRTQTRSSGRTVRNTNPIMQQQQQQQQQQSQTISKPTPSRIMIKTSSTSTSTTEPSPSKSTLVLSSCSICNASQYIKYHSKFISTVQVQYYNDTDSYSNNLTSTTYNVNSTCIQLEQRGQSSLLTSAECTTIHTLSNIPILCGCTSLLSNNLSSSAGTGTSSTNTNFTTIASQNLSNSIDNFFNSNNNTNPTNATSSTALTNTTNVPSTSTSSSNITNSTTTTMSNENNTSTNSCTYTRNQSMILSTKFFYVSGSILNNNISTTNTSTSTGSTEKSLLPIVESIILRFIQYDINWTSILDSSKSSTTMINITNTTTNTADTASTDTIAQIITNNYTIRNILLNEVFVNFLEETVDRNTSTLLLNNNNFTYNHSTDNNTTGTDNSNSTTGKNSNSSASNISTNNTLYYPIQILFKITMSFNYTTIAINPITNNAQRDNCQSTIQPLPLILPLLFQQELIHQQQQFHQQQQSSVCNVTVDTSNNASNTNTSIVLVARDNNYTSASTNIYNDANYSKNSFQCFHHNYKYIDPFKLLHRIKVQSTTVPYLTSVTTIEIQQSTNVSNNQNNSNVHDVHDTNNDDKPNNSTNNKNYKNSKAKDIMQLVGLALIVLCVLVLLIIIWIFCLGKSQFLSKHCSCCTRCCINTHNAKKSQTTDIDDDGDDGNKESIASYNHHQQKQIVRPPPTGTVMGNSASNNYSTTNTKKTFNLNSNNKYSDSLTSRTSLMHNSTTNKGESLSSIDVYDDNHKSNVISRNSSNDDIDDEDTFLKEPQIHQLSSTATAIKRNRSYSSLDDEDCYHNIIKNTTTSTTFLTGNDDNDDVIDSNNNVFDSVWDGQRKSAGSVAHSTGNTRSAKVGKRSMTASDGIDGVKNDDFDFVVRDRTVPPPLPPTISVPYNNTELDVAIERNVHDEYGLDDDNMSFQASPLPRHPRYDNYGNPVRMAAQAASYYRSIANNGDANNNTLDPDDSDSTTGKLIHTPKSTTEQTRSPKYVDTYNHDDIDKPWLSHKRRSSPRDGITGSCQMQKGEVLQSPVESHTSIANIVGTSIEPPFVCASHSVQQHQNLSRSKTGKKQSGNRTTDDTTGHTECNNKEWTSMQSSPTTVAFSTIVATASKYTDKDNADPRRKRQTDETNNIVHLCSGGITNKKNVQKTPTQNLLSSSTSSSSSSSSSTQSNRKRYHNTDRSVGSLSAPFRKTLNLPATSTPSNGYDVVESKRHPTSDDDSYSSLEVSRVSVVRQNRQSQVGINKNEQSQSNYIKKVVTAPAGKLNILVDTTSNGPMIHKVNPGSPLQGYVYPGDVIVAIDNVETQTMSSSSIMQLMISTAHKSRQFSLLSERTRQKY